MTKQTKAAATWPRVNGEPCQPGCYVEGSWGQYAPDHTADRFEELTGSDIAPDDDPRVWRRIADLYGARGDTDREFTAWEIHYGTADQLVDKLNAATTGGAFVWRDGELFLEPDVCQYCGRNWREDPDGSACDYCADVWDW